MYSLKRRNPYLLLLEVLHDPQVLQFLLLSLHCLLSLNLLQTNAHTDTYFSIYRSCAIHMDVDCVLLVYMLKGK